VSSRFAWRAGVVGAALLHTFYAAQAPAEEGERRRRVHFVVAAKGDELARLQRGLAEQGAALSLDESFSAVRGVDRREVVTRGAPGTHAADDGALRVWVDATAPSRLTFFVRDEAHDHVLVRELDGADAEVLRESLFNAVGTALEALLRGEAIGVTREEARVELAVSDVPEPPRDAPPASARRSGAPERPRAGARVRVGWVTALAASDLVTQGIGAGADATYDAGRFGLALGLEGAFRFPFSVRNEPLTLDVEGGAARGVAAIEKRLSPLVAVRGALGAGAEWYRTLAVLDAASPLLVMPPATRAVFVAHVAFLSRWTLFAGAPNLLAGLDLDVDPSGLRFIVDVGGQHVSLLSPYSVRPGLTITIETP
jgi:hypothetical protein